MMQTGMFIFVPRDRRCTPTTHGTGIAIAGEVKPDPTFSGDITLPYARTAKAGRYAPKVQTADTLIAVNMPM